MSEDEISKGLFNKYLCSESDIDCVSKGFKIYVNVHRCMGSEYTSS